MKTWTETITRREGEWFDIEPFDLDDCNTFPNDPAYRKERYNKFLEVYKLFKEGKKIKVWYDPMISGKLLNIGMYDGWPFWYKYPSMLIGHWMGPEVHLWSDLRYYEFINEDGNE